MRAGIREGGMGFFGWLVLALIVLGLMGVGPCSSCLSNCQAKSDVTCIR